VLDFANEPTRNGATRHETKRDGAAVRLDLAMLHGRNDAGLRSRLSARQLAWTLSYGIELIEEVSPSLNSKTQSASIYRTVRS
jgi:hypothetical protein